jgi:hypothetical protein
MIYRVREWAPVPTAFRGGPPPRTPDSLYFPAVRPTRINLTYTYNDHFGMGPDLHRYIKRVAPYNVKAGILQIQQPLSRHTTARPHYVTIRNGAPSSLSYLVPPLGE